MNTLKKEDIMQEVLIRLQDFPTVTIMQVPADSWAKIKEKDQTKRFEFHT